MNDYGVTDRKARELLARMNALNLKESDIEETFVKGSGRGGQKLNKSNSCVQLTHVPTGIVVRCQQERSRALNRFFARRELCRRLEQADPERANLERDKAEKVRKAKARTARRHRRKRAERDVPPQRVTPDDDN